jgi:hypothetical protein
VPERFTPANRPAPALHLRLGRGERGVDEVGVQVQPRESGEPSGRIGVGDQRHRGDQRSGRPDGDAAPREAAQRLGAARVVQHDRAGAGALLGEHPAGARRRWRARRRLGDGDGQPPVGGELGERHRVGPEGGPPAGPEASGRVVAGHAVDGGHPERGQLVEDPGGVVGGAVPSGDGDDER